MIRAHTITAAAERIRAIEGGEKPTKAEQKALYLLAAGGRLLSPAKAPIPSVVHAEARQASDAADARQDRKDVRAACVERANGCCEACGTRRGIALVWDHFWGRAREESVESCWMLCARCNSAKTENFEDGSGRRARFGEGRIYWLEVFGNHVRLHRYFLQEVKVDRALALERAQHPEHARG